MDALVISSVKIHLGRRIGIALILILLMVASLHLPIVQSVHATDQECEEYRLDSDDTQCLDYLNPDTGAILPGAQYYKCADHIECNKDENNKITRRCCIVPREGSYGGNCLDLSTIDRKDLGVGTNATNFIDIRPRKCTINEDALSPSTGDVIVVPPILVDNPNALPGERDKIPQEQSLVEFYANAKKRNEPSFNPDFVPSVPDLPIYEETVVVTQYAGITLRPYTTGVTWYYSVDEERVRRYFIHKRDLGVTIDIPNPYHLSGYRLNYVPYHLPMSTTDVMSRIGCKIANVFRTPLYSITTSITKLATNSENLPDISLLCTKGTPQFSNPSSITFDEDGQISGYESRDCWCTDTNSGPGTAAVLLCTRFVAGIEDGRAPWRILVPAPDESGQGSSRFVGLLFGIIEDTDSINEFTRKVDQDIKEFFASNTEAWLWIGQIIRIARNQSFIEETLLDRFFGQKTLPDPNEINIDTFKKNYFVRQYIGCLSCAKYGGFPTALGCMPADRVDRFLTEGVLGIGIGIAGAISVLCIIYGAIQFQLSEGEAAKVQKAQKLITQCILGLLLILFSVFLLRFVGVNLLRIYGLG